MPTATQPLPDRLALAKLIGEELQSPGLYGAPIRIRKFEMQGRTVTGEFVGAEDGRSYAFTYANGKVSYRPAVARLDSESVNQYAVRWDSHTAALEPDFVPMRMDAAKRLKCGSANYQCGGTCLGVHKNCHKNEKAAINKDRLNKINNLIDHLTQGGEHPSKALDKPGVEKLQAKATQIQETRDLRAANLTAKRAGDRMTQSVNRVPGVKKHSELSPDDYNQARKEGRPLYFTKELPSGAHALMVHDPHAGKDKIGITSFAGSTGKTPKEAVENYEAMTTKPKPATMTVGAIVPGTDKPPQLIPQTTTVTPEVLPPEVERSPRSKRLAAMTQQLRQGESADNRNAAQIQAVANTVLQQLDPTYAPQLSTPTASSYQVPKGTPKQRTGKLIGDLKECEVASNRNAAMGLAVAQASVNELAKRQQGQQAPTAKAITGAEKGAIAGSKKTTMPSHHYESTILGLKANYSVQKERLTSLKEKKKEAARRIRGGASAIQFEIIQVESKMKELSRGIKEHETKLKELRSRQKPVESAPTAPKSRSRTAGDLGDRGKYRHVSIDSMTAAISKCQQHIDSATAIYLLRRADACQCEQRQHKDEMSKYDRLVKSLAANGADDPKALAAAIERRKLGKKEFQRRAKAGAREAARV